MDTVNAYSASSERPAHRGGSAVSSAAVAVWSAENRSADVVRTALSSHGLVCSGSQQSSAGLGVIAVLPSCQHAVLGAFDRCTSSGARIYGRSAHGLHSAPTAEKRVMS